ncbi:uncharacterized protein LOC143037990 isoform X2 [Oratosquilla oratoria]|uniref:uncharacterized protein LOC143037990 isoform X2 n=1 Tax=Oratosquilla oratoria TaxID=337810 RepID=UPI003F76A1EE
MIMDTMEVSLLKMQMALLNTVSQVEHSIQQEVLLWPVLHNSPAVNVEQPVCPQQKGHLPKKKLVQGVKKGFLELAAERHQRNMDANEKLHQAQLKLIRHERRLLTSYAKKEALLDLKIKHEIARHEKEMSSR